MEKLFAMHFTDARERTHVVAVKAPAKEDALQKVIAFWDRGEDGTWYNGFWREPTIRDVIEIDPAATDEGVQILYHQDYD